MKKEKNEKIELSLLELTKVKENMKGKQLQTYVTFIYYSFIDIREHNEINSTRASLMII